MIPHRVFGRGPRAPADEFDFSVRGGTRYELHQTLRPPFEILQVVLFNSALVVAGWFLLGPDSVTNSHFTSLVFLPAVIASWAFADVPSTNLYGSQPARALSAIAETARDTEGNTRKLRNLIMARDLTLWLLVAPATAILAIYLVGDDHDAMGTFGVAGAVLLTPFGALGLASIMAPLLPYHPVPMRRRRELRSTWVRWLVCVCLPYVLIAPASLIVLLPTILLMEWQGRTDAVWLACVAVTVGWTLLVRRLSVDLTIGLTVKRRTELRAYLADPSRG